MILPITIGIFVFALLIIAFKLEDKHTVFKFFSLFFAIIGLVIVAKAGIDSKNVCSIEINNSVVSGNTTSYTYSNYCFTDTTYQKTSQIFYGFTLAYIGLLFLYLLVFLFYFGGEFLQKI